MRDAVGGFAMWSAGPCAGAAHGPSVPASLVAEASVRVFASLARSGYRRKAEQYVRALLDVPGRKTLTSIGAQWGGAAAGQSVHHFITASPWDWRPVRRSLARYAQQVLSPEALVVEPAVVLGAAPRAAGAGRCALRRRTPAGTGPQALGAWLVSAAGSVPVDWHLLPSPQLGGATGSRPGAGGPPGSGSGHGTRSRDRTATAGALGAHVLASATDAARLLPGRRGPVVVDADGLDAVDVVHGLRSLGDEFVVRVKAGTPLRIDRARLPRCDARPSTAARIAGALAELRRPLGPCDPAVTAAAVPVAFDGPSTRDDPFELMLLSEWESRREPRSFWLTNLRTLPLSALMRLARLPGRVRHDMTGVSERLGLRDYAGRSYRGCHHHLTLVSVAQLLTVVHAMADHPPEPRTA
ncbi:transposase [Streptomyces longwoodensis]|uniref:IS701 family transposase n=1 Tax=Streptomyces longwoodensis TaxID=68231 RepID=UPI0036EDD7D7